MFIFEEILKKKKKILLCIISNKISECMFEKIKDSSKHFALLSTDCFIVPYLGNLDRPTAEIFIKLKDSFEICNNLMLSQ